jgi:hypothetical protein
MHWFKWTYFHERALLFPQRCCQGHGAANAASHEDQFPRGWQRRVAGSYGFVPRCWEETDGGGKGSSACANSYARQRF